MTARRRRPLAVLVVAGFATVVIVSLGLWSILPRRVSITESCILDAAVLDQDFNLLKAVMIAARTRPEADKLDLEGMRLLAPDGTAFPARNWAGDPVAQQFGTTYWVLFIVPDKYVGAGGLTIVTKTGTTVPLPDAIRKKSIEEIKNSQ